MHCITSVSKVENIKKDGKNTGRDCGRTAVALGTGAHTKLAPLCCNRRKKRLEVN